MDKVLDQFTKIAEEQKEEKSIKCVVWDLDNTVWEGILLEDSNVKLKNNVVDIIKTLDQRGILHSIASKNNYEQAIEQLKKFGIEEYFLYPQISWNPKSKAVETIATSINIGIDTIAFVDDQDYELEEVKFSHPKVLCINTENVDKILDIPAMNPRFITQDSALRRAMYLTDIERKKAEDEFVGPKEDFLASLNMVFVINSAKEEDLKRAEELTLRTNQLNATGYTYSYEELDQFRQSDKYKLLIAGLDDKYGSYGKIGLALIECRESSWVIKLLLMSCRVMSRGVGTVLINHIRNLARERNIQLLAEFIHTDRNRMMYVTYKFNGFKETNKIDNLVIFEDDINYIQNPSNYIKIEVLD